MALVCGGAVALLAPSRAGGAAEGAAPGALKPFEQTLPGSVVKIEMMPVPAGTITIRSARGKGAPKTVPIKPFWIAKMETVWEAYDVFTSSGPPSPSYDRTPFGPDAVARPSKTYIPPDLGWGHHGYPVINESCLSATMFCRWLSSKTGKKYRLPSEAEWEYACRAGRPGASKPTPAELAQCAWYAANSNNVTHPAGKKLPNGWGLYDMTGNAGEWATDIDGKPVLCGGSWQDKAANIGPTARSYPTPDWQATDPQLPKSRWWLSDANFAGFRIVCEP